MTVQKMHDVLKAQERVVSELCNEVMRLRAENDTLRSEASRLQAKVRELEDIPTCPVCGEPMTRRNADGTLGCNLCYALDGDA